MTFWQTMGFGEQGWAADMLLATLMSCAIAFCGFACGGLIGGVGCWAKRSRFRSLRALADLYTTVLRGVPDLLIIYLFYFGSSMVLTQAARELGLESFVGLPPFLVGVVAIAVVSGAYQIEVLRGAMGCVPRGTLEAGRALGLDGARLLLLVIAPQALRFALPGLANVWLLVLKESALISVVGMVELMRQAQIGAGATHQPFWFYGTAGALYLLVSVSSSQCLGRLERRLALPSGGQ
ncbi:ABC transporter permease subunit [Pseudomonas sp. MWU16-30317]|uniref:ABC transporter permease n=1 Tax=Pseudomonas sp. MWU16-30317 TaxID=2878095 RepID=UPI001CFC06C1|nr:ABC transporter permease subunit [Pseudomonas sp. MWU16-30317]